MTLLEENMQEGNDQLASPVTGEIVESPCAPCLTVPARTRVRKAADGRLDGERPGCDARRPGEAGRISFARKLADGLAPGAKGRRASPGRPAFEAVPGEAEHRPPEARRRRRCDRQGGTDRKAGSRRGATMTAADPFRRPSFHQRRLDSEVAPFRLDAERRQVLEGRGRRSGKAA